MWREASARDHVTHARAMPLKTSGSRIWLFPEFPYVQGVSKKIGCILNQHKVKVAYKPQQTINSLFPRLKELYDSDRQKSGIVYKISCTQCNFVYYGQTERSLKTGIVEHKRQWQVLTRILKLQAMFTFPTIIWTLKMSSSLVSNRIIMSDFFSKPGTLLWTRTLGTIISFFRKSTKASREHELHGRAR